MRIAAQIERNRRQPTVRSIQPMPKTQERMGRRVIGVRGLMIRTGSSPSECTSRVPTTLKEAKPKAGSIRSARCVANRIADGRRSPEAEPRSSQTLSPLLTSLIAFHTGGRVTSTKINRGERRWEERHVGPAAQKCACHPPAGVNLRRDEPHERCRATRGKGQLPGQAAKCLSESGSGTPRRRNALVHDPNRTAARSGGARYDRIADDARDPGSPGHGGAVDQRWRELIALATERHRA
jgi:hypothetical protein